MKIIHYEKLSEEDENGMKYVLLTDWFEFVPFLGYRINIPKGRKSDGATWARDLGAIEKGWRKYWSRLMGWLFGSPINSRTSAWWSHDEICITGTVTNWQGDRIKISNFFASLILSIILFRDGYKKECIPWFFATFFGGGGECKKNGWFKVSKGK